MNFFFFFVELPALLSDLPVCLSVCLSDCVVVASGEFPKPVELAAWLPYALACLDRCKDVRTYGYYIIDRTRQI